MNYAVISMLEHCFTCLQVSWTSVILEDLFSIFLGHFCHSLEPVQKLRVKRDLIISYLILFPKYIGVLFMKSLRHVWYTLSTCKVQIKYMFNTCFVHI